MNNFLHEWKEERKGTKCFYALHMLRLWEKNITYKTRNYPTGAKSSSYLSGSSNGTHPSCLSLPASVSLSIRFPLENWPVTKLILGSEAWGIKQNKSSWCSEKMQVSSRSLLHKELVVYHLQKVSGKFGWKINGTVFSRRSSEEFPWAREHVERWSRFSSLWSGLLFGERVIFFTLSPNREPVHRLCFSEGKFQTEVRVTFLETHLWYQF